MAYIYCAGKDIFIGSEAISSKSGEFEVPKKLQSGIPLKVSVRVIPFFLRSRNRRRSLYTVHIRVRFFFFFYAHGVRTLRRFPAFLDHTDSPEGHGSGGYPESEAYLALAAMRYGARLLSKRIWEPCGKNVG